MSIDQPNSEINCGGYALGLNKWYEPYSIEMIQDEIYTGLLQGIPYKIMMDYIFRLTFDKIHLDMYAKYGCECDFHYLYAQVRDKNYTGVAYRIGLHNYDLSEVDDPTDIDWDFHFRRYTAEDGWTEKIGTYAPSKVEDIYDWSNINDFHYNSQTKLFIIKN